jgi:hypothetical protein
VGTVEPTLADVLLEVRKVGAAVDDLTRLVWTLARERPIIVDTADAKRFFRGEPK